MTRITIELTEDQVGALIVALGFYHGNTNHALPEVKMEIAFHKRILDKLYKARELAKAKTSATIER